LLAANHEKTAMRERLLLRRLEVPAEQRASQSTLASGRLVALPCVQQAGTVAFYAAVGSEADPSPAVEACLSSGKRVVFPRITPGVLVLEFAAATPDELVSGPHRTRQPPPLTAVVHPGEIDCIVVPGIAFDPHGRRLGRGGGFYDATLAALPRRATRLGFALDIQIVPVVPSEGHDVPMDVVVTDARVLHVAQAADAASH